MNMFGMKPRAALNLKAAGAKHLMPPVAGLLRSARNRARGACA